MFVLLAAHLVAGLFLVAAGSRLGRRAFVAAATVPVVSFAWAISRIPEALAGELPEGVAALDVVLLKGVHDGEGGADGEEHR